MSDIKFRAWDPHKKVMMSDGDFFINANGTIFQPYEYVGDGDDVPMNHLIIMQYIGLKDKNGKEIYVGDIIRGIDKNIDLVVGYNSDLAGYMPFVACAELAKEARVIGYVCQDYKIFLDI